MIKKGDFVVCIEDVISYNSDEIRFIKGKKYEIKHVSQVGNDEECFEFELYSEEGESGWVGRSGWVSFTKGSWCYSENFMLLNEWLALERDKKINQILEDE